VSTPRTLARRYARALLDVAGTGGADAVLALRDELRAFAPVLAGHAELGAALLHPGVGAEQKQRVLAALAERAGATELLRRLLDLLAVRDRIALLPDVVEAYAGLANAAQGVISAEVVSAASLPEEQKRALGAALRGGGASVELRERVEPDLVGGLLVRSGGRTYDGSVRTRLAALRRRLSGLGPSARAS
jgi:F-type H+-transporting ATPase subunit delta